MKVLGVILLSRYLHKYHQLVIFLHHLVNLSPILESVNNSIQNPPAENPPPAQILPTSFIPIGNFSPISDSVNPLTENTLIEPNLPELNNPPVVMSTPHPHTLVRKNSQR